MGQIMVLREALKARIETSMNDPQLTVTALIPDSANVPCAWIEPARPVIDYQQAFRSGLAEWHFVIKILTNRVDIEAAQVALDEYIEPDGPLVSGLQDDSIQDAFAELTNRSVVVTEASRYGLHPVGGTQYFGVELSICFTS